MPQLRRTTSDPQFRLIYLQKKRVALAARKLSSGWVADAFAPQEVYNSATEAGCDTGHHNSPVGADVYCYRCATEFNFFVNSYSRRVRSISAKSECPEYSHHQLSFMNLVRFY